MTQLSLTDDRIMEASAAEPTEPQVSTEPNSANEVEKQDVGPIAEHQAVADVNIEAMELETDAEGWEAFPHPARIRCYVEEDMDADQSSFPSEVQDAIDELTDNPDRGEFLVFDATEAYEYLETLQWKSDLHLENFHRRQLIVNQLSNGRGYAKGSNLSTYDKKWICQWEVQRRLADRDFDKWGDETKLTKENHGLPNSDA